MAVFIASYRQIWARWNDFSGKTDRGDFWQAVLVELVIALVVRLLSLIPVVGPVIHIAYLIAISVPLLAMTWRRMRDAGGKGWFALIPVVNLVFACMESK